VNRFPWFDAEASGRKSPFSDLVKTLIQNTSGGGMISNTPAQLLVKHCWN
jgi:hypothetical protein